ncbi:MAG TPA: hypothetical protein VEY09_02145 [Pyrinomonadaceae bacterium]|nr:hypothetical protein [Pyrinomonadaceae bacterium]
MRKTLTTAALLLALCCPTFAGEIHQPIVRPPGSAGTMQEASLEMYEEESITSEGLAEVVLSLLESVLGLL